MESAKRHVLLTGSPGVGKTRLIRDVAHQLSDLQPAGFYTEEVRLGAVRQGFKLISLDGRELILAHVHHRSRYKVSRYGVDVVGFERVLEDLDLCHSDRRVIVIDEIGKMECFSERFRSIVTQLLDSPKSVLATIALKGNGYFTAIKQRPDCELVIVTMENRSDLPGALSDSIRGMLRNAN